MGIDISSLSPWAQKQIAEKLAAENVRRAEMAQEAKKGGGKYHSVPTGRTAQNGAEIRFDSKKEARRFDELMLMLKAGKISDLKLQPQFTLQEAYTTPEGNRVRAIRYQADFSYWRDGAEVVEDVKSKATKTRVYGIKKKLMREKFGIEIREIE